MTEFLNVNIVKNLHAFRKGKEWTFSQHLLGSHTPTGLVFRATPETYMAFQTTVSPPVWDSHLGSSQAPCYLYMPTPLATADSTQKDTWQKCSSFHKHLLSTYYVPGTGDSAWTKQTEFLARWNPDYSLGKEGKWVEHMVCWLATYTMVKNSRQRTPGMGQFEY